MSMIFISYRRKDCPDICEQIYQRLQKRFGKDVHHEAVFLDKESFHLGENYKQRIEKEITSRGRTAP